MKLRRVVEERRVNLSIGKNEENSVMMKSYLQTKRAFLFIVRLISKLTLLHRTTNRSYGISRTLSLAYYNIPFPHPTVLPNTPPHEKGIKGRENGIPPGLMGMGNLSIKMDKLPAFAV